MVEITRPKDVCVKDIMPEVHFLQRRCCEPEESIHCRLTDPLKSLFSQKTQTRASLKIQRAKVLFITLFKWLCSRFGWHLLTCNKCWIHFVFKAAGICCPWILQIWWKIWCNVTNVPCKRSFKFTKCMEIKERSTNKWLKKSIKNSKNYHVDISMGALCNGK